MDERCTWYVGHTAENGHRLRDPWLTSGQDRSLSEPRPGFVVRRPEMAGWTFHPPRLDREGAYRRLEFLSLGPDGEGLARIVADWTSGSSAAVTVERAR